MQIRKLLIGALAVVAVMGPGIAALAKPEITIYTLPWQNSGFYHATTALLQQHVQNGQVNYKSLQQDMVKLDALVKQIARYDVTKATDTEKKAFYINAYNLLVLKQVLAHYPLKSVMDVPGFFDRKQFTVAGEELTLNELENKKLRQPYRDARIHFALVCAAKSCPVLLNEAYLPQNLNGQLQAQTKLALQNPAFIKVYPTKELVQVSEIFKWYGEDFLAEAPSVAAYINQFRAKPLPAKYKVGYYTYDWSLNDI